MAEEFFKGQTNLRVLNQFVNATDQVVKALIPREDAWQIKNHVIKNLNVKIHTAEIIANTKKSRSKHGSVLEASRSRSPKTNYMARAKTSFQKSRGSSKEELPIEDDNSSYEAYVQTLSRRANMQ